MLIKGPFTHHSIRVDDDDEIVRIVEACRQAVGPDMTLMLDVLYCSGDWKSALNVFTKLEESDIYFVETPCCGSTIPRAIPSSPRHRRSAWRRASC